MGGPYGRGRRSATPALKGDQDAATQDSGPVEQGRPDRVTKHVAPWMPGFGVVAHAGRRSGRRYQTPVNVFPAGTAIFLP